MLRDSPEWLFYSENDYANFGLKERTPNKYTGCRKIEAQ